MWNKRKPAYTSYIYTKAINKSIKEILNIHLFSSYLYPLTTSPRYEKALSILHLKAF